MKNYLCINGKKTALTKEQMKQLGILIPVAELSADGKIAKIGEYEFIVIKKDETLGTVELLLKGTLGKNMVFGDNNDYRTSAVRKVVEKFGEEIAELVGEENLLEHTVDLTAVSGLKDFGSIKAKMSLLTFDKARENIELLDQHKLGCYWWLATATSTKKHDIEYSVACVAPRGYFDYYNSNYCIIIGGVRPFCVLKSCIFES